MSRGLRNANLQHALEYGDGEVPIGLRPIQRYAMLLTGGFITLDQDETHTGDRAKYDDPNGRYGLATTADGVVTSYYYDDAEGAWYDADVDGNRLIGF